MADAKKSMTDEQRFASDPSVGSLLVSAAAGSGKTFVLTQRVISILAAPKPLCRPEELLIVTFTKAAASEMREKIYKALSDKIADASASSDSATTSRLLKVRGQLDRTEICTIDSFLGNLVRENYSLADIEPDFRYMEDGESSILCERVLRETVESLYESDRETFSSLSDLFSGSHDDNGLINAVSRLYEFSSCYPEPEKWLRSIADSYDSQDPSTSPWGRFALDDLRTRLRRLRYMLSRSHGEHLIGEKNVMAGEAQLEYMDELIRSADSEPADWDNIISLLGAFSNKGFRAPSGSGSTPGWLAGKEIRDFAKNEIASLKDLMCASADELREDSGILAPQIKELINTVLVYKNSLDEAKKEINAYRFDDITHKAAAMLSEHDPDGELVPSAAAAEISGRYFEILVDEYQDTNEAQDLIFSFISKNGDKSNMFVVGDVKQSIYGFRLASPELFLSERNRRAEPDSCEAGAGVPLKISLDRNFRSRSEIISSVNYVFNTLMTSAVGDVNYRDGEGLVYGAAYPDPDGLPAQEFHILNIIKPDGGSSLPQARTCAEYTARLIENNAYQVTDSEGELRPAAYGDFCILLRTNKNVDVFRKVFAQYDIPVTAGDSRDFFGSYETDLAVSLLKVIDNPLRDIELLTVMLSPLYGFNADELAAMRAGDRHRPLYLSVRKAAGCGSERAARLVSELTHYRAFCSAMKLADLFDALYTMTSLPEIVSGMPDGDVRRRNLMILRKLAVSYSAFSGDDFGSFIRYLDRLADSGSEVAGALPKADAVNSVRIITLHKSKGLEFPIVIMPVFQNEAPTRADIILTKKFGIGVKVRVPSRLQKYPSLPYTVSCKVSDDAERSDQMRLLYVAMTRAKEKFITLDTFSSKADPFNRITHAARMISSLTEQPEAFTASVTSFSDWLIAAFLRHPDLRSALAQYASSSTSQSAVDANDAACMLRCDEPDFALKTVFADVSSPLTASERPRSETNRASCGPVEDFTPERIAAFLKQVQINMADVYPYGRLAAMPAKLTASALNDLSNDSEYSYRSQPAFVSGGGHDAAAKGTATHRFLEVCDLRAAAVDIGKEAERIERSGLMPAEDLALADRGMISSFLASPTGMSILGSDRILREKEFSMLLPARYFDSTLGEPAGSDLIVIQGKIDLIFITGGRAVVLDYKTDRVKAVDELLGRYRSQMDVYRIASQKVFGLAVDDCILYSLHLGRGISCNDDGSAVV